MTRRWASLALVFAGCGLFRAHDDELRRLHVSRISGTVHVDADRHVPIVVAILRSTPGTPTLVVTDHVQLFSPGSYELIVTPGRYRVVAFEDANHDVQFQSDERVDAFDRFRETAVDGAHPCEANLRITEGSHVDLRLPPIEMGDDATRGIAIGTRVALDDERLSQTTGELGAWEPVRYMEEGHAGIFVLDEPSPERVPVVFVHGFAGWPRQFDAIVEHLDRGRYQPWLVTYPSGWGLEDVARILRASLDEMLTLHPSARVCVVAHSMGGLVSWRMLTRGPQGDPVAASVRGLVTIASPLGGQPAAEAGLQQSPVVLAAWRDLAPSSDLVHAVATTPLADGVGYTLLFAFAPGQGSDGVVPLPAQLPRFAQDRAARMAGFPTTHVGILHDDGARDEVLRALDRCATTP